MLLHGNSFSNLRVGLECTIYIAVQTWMLKLLEIGSHVCVNLHVASWMVPVLKVLFTLLWYWHPSFILKQCFLITESCNLTCAFSIAAHTRITSLMWRGHPRQTSLWLRAMTGFGSYGSLEFHLCATQALQLIIISGTQLPKWIMMWWEQNEWPWFRSTRSPNWWDNSSTQGEVATCPMMICFKVNVLRSQGS